MSHTDELYLFWSPYWFQNLTLNTEDASQAQTMVRLWTDFAKTGAPAPPDTGVGWEPVVEGHHEYLEIDNDGLTMTASPQYLKRVNFWRDIMSQRP